MDDEIKRKRLSTGEKHLSKSNSQQSTTAQASSSSSQSSAITSPQKSDAIVARSKNDNQDNFQNNKNKKMTQKRRRMNPPPARLTSPAAGGGGDVESNNDKPPSSSTLQKKKRRTRSKHHVKHHLDNKTAGDDAPPAAAAMVTEPPPPTTKRRSKKSHKNCKGSQQNFNGKKKNSSTPKSSSSPPHSLPNNRGRRRQKQKITKHNKNDNPTIAPPFPSSKNEATISKYTTRHYMAPPLSNSNGNVMVPALPVVVTNDENVIKQWLRENTIHKLDGENNSEDSNNAVLEAATMVLGFDSESITKPPWMMPQRDKLPDGPAIVQLSTVSSCLIVRCSRIVCGDDNKNAIVPFYSTLTQDVLGNANIVKAGVAIDNDALELYQWSSLSSSSAEATDTDKNTSTSWKMTSRFDLGGIITSSSSKSSDPNNPNRAGLRQLAHEILNIDLPKSKQVVMSNWHAFPYLSSQQISYAARDAWVAAAIVQKLCEYRKDVFGANVLIGTVLKNELCIEKVDEKANKKKKEYKAVMRRYKRLKKRKEKFESSSGGSSRGGGDDDDDEVHNSTKNDQSFSSGGAMNVVWGDKEEKRMAELWDIMCNLRPESPPVFDNKGLGLPF